MDFPVALLGDKADFAQKARGERIKERAELRWRGWGLDCIIWWNSMKESKDQNWFSYESQVFKWPFGSQEPNTPRHLVHVHLSFIRGFTYRPPRNW